MSEINTNYLQQRLAELSEAQKLRLSDLLELTPRGPQRLRLVAFAAPSDGQILDEGELRAYAQEQLPAALLPEQFVLLETLPAMPNGKIDRRALRALDLRALQPQTAEPPELLLPRTETEQKLAAIWSDVLGIEPIDVRETFYELGGDSLLAMQTVARAQQQGLAVSARQLDSEQTIAGLSALLEADAAEETAAAEEEDAAAPRKKAAVKQTADPILLPVNRRGSKTPFFFTHGIYGDVASVRNFGPLMADDQPVYGLQAVGLDPEVEPDRTMAAMAERYVNSILRAQPEGPYRVGGFCFGGVLAYEIAHQMEQQGLEVGLLAIIEGSAPAKYHRLRPLLDGERLRIVRETAPSWLNGYQEFGGWRVADRLRYRLGVGDEPGLGPGLLPAEEVEFDNLADMNARRPQSQQALRLVNIDAILSYDPPPIAGKVTFIRARSLRVGHALKGGLDPSRGWGSLAAGGVDVRYVDGTHGGVLHPQNAASLAGVLTDLLDR